MESNNNLAGVKTMFLKSNTMGMGRGQGVALGVALGVAFGAAFGNVGVGLALGLAIGAAMDANARRTKPTPDPKDPAN